MRAGLEPIGDDGYFQTASVEADRPGPNDFQATIRTTDGPVSISMDRVSVGFAERELNITNLPAVTLPFTMEVGEIDAPDGLVVMTSIEPSSAVPTERRREYFQKYSAFMNQMSDLGVVAVLDLNPESEAPSQGSRSFGRGGWPAVFTIHSEDIAGRLGLTIRDGWNLTDDAWTIDLQYKTPKRVDVPVRNVVGLLRGSDPELADEYIIVTAHYDHVGIGSPVDGDAIYNGANDDGSGTTCVIEIAAAMAGLDAAPKRSIIFMCVYGEERGLLGSRHYVSNPIVPLKQTVANINLEHMGRTDDSEGPSVNRVMPTGFDYSSTVEPFVEAGEQIGFNVDHHPMNSANFFARSDNAAFARVGIPAHTFCTAFIFPDYHGAGDHWDLVDYDNMAAAARMVALGLKKLANADDPPTWTEGHRQTGRYIEAWNKLHGIVR